MWCATPKEQKQNRKLRIILAFMEPCHIPNIKGFNEFFSIKCLTDFQDFLFVNGWYVAHLENEGGLSKILPGRSPIFHSLPKQVHIITCWLWRNSRENKLLLILQWLFMNIQQVLYTLCTR